MCGITGFIDLKAEYNFTDVITKMTKVIKHRGPDDEGIFVNNKIAFGHRRLSIIDLSKSATQPMRSNDGRFVIVYNGEIYNFIELRNKLKEFNYTFFSDSDTEVLLNSYIHFKEKCLDYLNGMFAFAIYDTEEETVFLARDRYGVKPLYYFISDELFIFSSEIKSILQHPKYKIQLCYEALDEYFTFQNVLSSKTLFKGISILESGSYITISFGKKLNLANKKYWDYNFNETDKKIDNQSITEELNLIFEKSVKNQLVSDVEIGAYLSGGMDSGAITSVASKFYKNIKTFTAGFDLSSASGLELAFDEREKAEFLSNLYKTEQYEVVLKAGDMERVVKKLVYHLEDLRVGQSYPNFYIANLASKFVKVVLSGVGGDELFAGYPWRYYGATNNNGFDDYIKKYYNYWQRLIDDSQKRDFFNLSTYKNIDPLAAFNSFKSVFKEKPFEETPENYINQSLYFEIKTFLHGLLIVEDKLGMAHGLETRFPFLDNNLVDFALKIPVRYKLNNMGNPYKIDENDIGLKSEKYFQKTNDGKIILRNVLAKYVPEEYANGIKKGFSAPDASWFKGESIDYIKNILLRKNASIYEYMNYSSVKKLLSEHFNGKVNRRLLIWSLLNFEWWIRIFMKGEEI